mgnify:FL=1
MYVCVVVVAEIRPLGIAMVSCCVVAGGISLVSLAVFDTCVAGCGDDPPPPPPLEVYESTSASFGVSTGSGADVNVFISTAGLLTGAVVGVGAVGCGDAVGDDFLIIDDVRGASAWFVLFVLLVFVV